MKSSLFIPLLALSLVLDVVIIAHGLTNIGYVAIAANWILMTAVLFVSQRNDDRRVALHRLRAIMVPFSISGLLAIVLGVT